MAYQSHTRDDLDDDRRPSVTKRRPRRASLLGLLSVLAGLAAVAVVNREQLRPVIKGPYLDQVGTYTVQPLHVAGAAAALAVLALLLRAMTGRTRAGWPLLGLLLAAGAAGTWRYCTNPEGKAEQWVRDNVVNTAVAKWDQFRNRNDAPPAQPAPPKTVEVSAPTPLVDGGGSTAIAPATPPSTADVPATPVRPPAATNDDNDPPKKKLFDTQNDLKQ